jgi:hypothetical protein
MGTWKYEDEWFEEGNVNQSVKNFLEKGVLK